MTERVPPERYPWWVRLSLLGAQSRISQWFWVGASLLATVILFVFAAGETGIVRALFAFAALWGLVAAGLYYFTIRWMDRHGTWPR